MTSGGELTYTAAAGEVNALTISRDAMRHVHRERHGAVTAGAGCSATASPNAAHAAAAGVERIVATLLDEADSATMLTPLPGRPGRRCGPTPSPAARVRTRSTAARTPTR